MALQVQKDVLGREMWVDQSGKVFTQGGTTPTGYDVSGWNARQQEKYGNGGGDASYEDSNMFSQQPTIDLNEMYTASMNDPELKSLEQEINTKKTALNTAMSNINDNPWYSEATRVGKLSKLQSMANAEMAVLSDQVAQKKADAQVKLNIATQQYNIESQQYQNNLSKLNMLISSGALLNATGADLAQIAVATGISSSMLNGIKDKLAKDQIKSQVITETDNSGNVTVAVIDANTGKVISKNSLGAIGKANTTSGSAEYKRGSQTYNEAVSLMSSDLQKLSGSDKRVSPDTWATLRSEWVQAGFDPSDFDSSFKGFINPTHAQDYMVGYASPNQSAVFNSMMGSWMGGGNP